MESVSASRPVGGVLGGVPQVAADPHAHAGRSGAASGVATFACDLVLGAEGAVKDMVGGVLNLLKHPVSSLKGLALLPVTLITRPGDVARAFTAPYTEALSSGHPGRAIGRGVVEIGALVLGAKSAIGALRGGHAAHAAGQAGHAAGQVASHAGHFAAGAT
ncbi:MAG: hypothetical protein FJZ01_26935, partial [Candidatus Sericytochromatia bacterium]|nr:hypothetical protein [Candidatus Tanganyikabacteria bacterium]